jgi:hypothetical protein
MLLDPLPFTTVVGPTDNFRLPPPLLFTSVPYLHCSLIKRLFLRGSVNSTRSACHWALQYFRASCAGPLAIMPLPNHILRCTNGATKMMPCPSHHVRRSRNPWIYQGFPPTLWCIPFFDGICEAADHFNSLHLPSYHLMDGPDTV